jgi:hypothetical protein
MHLSSGSEYANARSDDSRVPLDCGHRVQLLGQRMPILCRARPPCQCVTVARIGATERAIERIRSECHVSTDYHMAMTSLVWDILRYVSLMSL